MHPWHDPPEVRFRGSGLDEHPVGWEQLILDATGQRATISTVGEVHAGLGWMIAADLFRPCYEFLYRFSSSTMLEHARRLRDPDGFARLNVLCESNPRLHRLDRSHSFNQLARILIHNGGRLADITVADCVEAYRAQVGYTARQQSFWYVLLRQADILPVDTPPSIRAASRVGRVDDFLGHFTKRRVALGTCARPYGTPCVHEHACIRCPLLRLDHTQRRRLADIVTNLETRLVEAEHEHWHGEIDAITTSLTAARAKLESIPAPSQRTRTRTPL